MPSTVLRSGSGYRPLLQGPVVVPPSRRVVQRFVRGENFSKPLGRRPLAGVGMVPSS